MKTAFTIALAATCVASTAPAQTASPDAAPGSAANADAKPPKQKKVCQTQEATGSIMPQRVCHTPAEWAQIEQQNQANADSFARSRNLARGGH